MSVLLFALAPAIKYYCQKFLGAAPHRKGQRLGELTPL